VSGA
jgi:dynein intermediate chain 2